jgi:C4-dicarboxylate-specific signal transduction histidine kinase
MVLAREFPIEVSSGEDVERIFAAFHTTKRGGMGMSLAISCPILEAHAGRLCATSNADQLKDENP